MEFYIDLSNNYEQIIQTEFLGLGIELHFYYSELVGAWYFDLKTEKLESYGNALVVGMDLTKRWDLPFSLVVANLARTGIDPTNSDSFLGAYRLFIGERTWNSADNGN